jgi:hypothetical protein
MRWLLAVVAACGSSGSPPAVGDGPPPGTCDVDPLRTGLTAQQTGVSVDAFDCQVLEWTNTYGEPDPMVFKAIMYVESRFDQTAVACPNLPCGQPTGWSVQESGCLGLMQIVPACNGTPGSVGLLPNGHPNMTTDTTLAMWATSIFNPSINVDVGISGVSGNRAQEKAKFSGCTEDQYTMMAIGDYNSYGSTKSCTDYNTMYDNLVIEAYKQYAMAAGYTPHPY